MAHTAAAHCDLGSSWGLASTLSRASIRLFRQKGRGHIR